MSEEQPAEPLSPGLHEPGFSVSQEDMDIQRELFEDRGKDAVRARLREVVGTHASQREVDRFLDMLRDKGGGSIAVAWRRHFDSDGDGELSFKEFCAALIDLHYKGDCLGLWHDLLSRSARGRDTECLGLEDLDKDSAEILDYFGKWCQEQHGGPSEAFKVMDSDGSDSLTKDEFAEELENLGFFNLPDILEPLATKEGVTLQLFPLLDQYGTGAIACTSIMFLEKDVVKRNKVLRQLARMQQHGSAGAAEPLRNNAQRLLHKLAMSTTALGGKPWQMVTAKVAVGEDISSPRYSMGPPLGSSWRVKSMRGRPKSASMVRED